MVKGQEAKEYITKFIVENLGGFMNEKELRVQYRESSGEDVQIKIALTAAKVNVEAPSSINADGGVVITQEKTPDINYLTELFEKYHLGDD